MFNYSDLSCMVVNTFQCCSYQQRYFIVDWSISVSNMVSVSVVYIVLLSSSSSNIRIGMLHCVGI